MRTRSIYAIAAALAMSFTAPAFAQQAPATSEFRSVEAQSFTAEDIERYGLTSEEAARAVALQEQGYQIVALTPEEAEAYQAGAISTTEWILIGIGVLIILAIA